MRANITGLGICLPDGELTNAELAARLDTTEDWILSRTGIRTRRVASETDTTDELGRTAALDAIADAGLSPDDIDLVICATVTAEKRFPATACLIQSALGTHAPAFDIGAGCSGFLYALLQADLAIQAGAAQNVLVVGTEILSRITDVTDPKTSILFGDGAGAAVVQATETGIGFGPFRLYADGNRPHLLHVDRVTDLIHMDGREVYKAAVDGMASAVAELLDETGIASSHVDLVIAHQANQRILDAVGARLGVDPSIIYSNISRYGNTSAASIPIALHDARDEGRLERDSLVVLTAFGAGFTWGAGTMRWGAMGQPETVPAVAGANHA